MSQPLSPAGSSTLNLQIPATVERKPNYGPPIHSEALAFKPVDGAAFSVRFNDEESNGPPSSPFVADVEQENPSPPRNRSPSKSPSKRRSRATSFPIKIQASPVKTASVKTQAPTPLTEDALRDNEGLTRAIRIMEDAGEDSVIHYGVDDDDNALGEKSGYVGMDDTCFSTFSAVPNADMTLFARIGEQRDDTIDGSPTKQRRAMASYLAYDGNNDTAPTPCREPPSTPGTARRRIYEDPSPSPSPTPRRRDHDSRSEEGNTTSLILDFTEQFNSVSGYSQTSPSRRSRPSPIKSQTQPELATYLARGRTPSPAKKRHVPPSTPAEARYLANLLDFDIPPVPTPRSVPSITPRELETLKSSYLSQISSMRATLSGREAEVNSLKEAINDAERRVGEALEEIREERGTKETLQADKEQWEKRGREVEEVLQSVKEELIRGEREREELAVKLEESERKREDAESKTIEAESRVAGMRAGSASTLVGSETGSSESSGPAGKEVEIAVEKVARELHSLYKSKHEAKVGALKKSYEVRWEKRFREMEKKLEDTNKENENLKLGKDTTTSGPFAAPSASPGPTHETRMIEAQAEKLAVLSSEMATMKKDNLIMRRDLEKERLEKGDLVKAVEEMLSMSANQTSSSHADTTSLSSTGIDNLRGSVSRQGSGLKGPGFSSSISGESRIGRMNSSGSQSSGIGRSGIMSNIERMGRGRAGE
ncbi:MAG: hypothetical protein M1827_007529 [Pycnora praestabilis]|nr:MAG: hypothetical protein M1827_007529 [Pycnora praestabilis]